MVFLTVGLFAVGGPAWADPEADLTAAIGLYEAKKSEQAVKALRALVAAPDSSASVRARANLYIGLGLSKLGDAAGATAAFSTAFELDPTLPLPFGTRPDIMARAEVLRADARPVAQQQGPLQGVLELADVAGPALGPDPSGGVRRQPRPGNSI